MGILNPEHRLFGTPTHLFLALYSQASIVTNFPFECLFFFHELREHDILNICIRTSDSQLSQLIIFFLSWTMQYGYSCRSFFNSQGHKCHIWMFLLLYGDGRMWTFKPWTLTKNKQFWTYPPLLSHVVIERPLCM